MGAFDITVKNAGPIPAFWVHVAATAPAATPGAEAPSFVFRWPPTLLRLDPGDSTRLRVEYSRAAHDDPKPAISRFVVAVRNAYDIGVPLEVPVDLRFQAADLSLDAQRPVRNSDGFAVPVTVTNVGDEPTGRQLALSARFLGGNGSAVDSDFKTVYDDGLAPGIATTFSLKVPKEVGSGPFRVELAAREGIAANIAAESTTIGFVNQWTRTSPSLSPRLFWPLYLALALGLVLVVAGGRLAVVYGNPVVVEVAREAQSLLRRPLGHLPGASRALERANRLDGALGSLGVVAERWRRAVAVAQTPGSAAAAFADVLGGRLGDALYEAAAFRFELPALNLRYGPCVGLASVEGPRMETGDAVRIANAMRAAELGSVVVLDLTEAQNASAAFRNVAQVETVILSSNLLRDVLLASAPQRVFERTVAEQRPMGEISPYRIAAGIEEPAVFVGRDEELRKLADRDLHSAVLVGARQMGKSSLLKAVARRLATRGDVEVHYRVLASDDLMGELASVLGAPRPETVEAFQAMVRGRRGRPRVWLIDEADRFAVADLALAPPNRGRLSWALRALAEEGTAYFVLAGFWGLFHAAVFDAGSPLRNLGEIIRLGPLDRSAARTLVREPLASLGLQVDDDAVDAILREAGCRANVVALACQGLLERLGKDQRVIRLEDVSRVWSEDGALRDWKGEPLDRAVAHAAFSLDRPTRKQIEERLASAKIRPQVADLDFSFERLELGYVLTREEAKEGADRWTCPVPLLKRFEERIMSWDDHLERDAGQLRERSS
jgi:hypothetical protein